MVSNVCSRSQGHPSGERRRAMISTSREKPAAAGDSLGNSGSVGGTGVFRLACAAVEGLEYFRQSVKSRRGPQSSNGPIEPKRGQQQQRRTKLRDCVEAQITFCAPPQYTADSEENQRPLNSATPGGSHPLRDHQ